MTRPSSNLDKKMLKAGRKIVSTEGSDGLSIPKICSLAKANLGMFNYHFGTKENYIKILYSSFKDDVTKYLGIDKMEGTNPLDKIKTVMEKFAEYIADKPNFARSIFFDGLSNGTKFSNYIMKGVIPRYDHLIALIQEAQEQGYIRTDIPTAETFVCFSFGIIGPEIFKSATFDTEKVYELDGPKAEDFTITDRFIHISEGFLTDKGKEYIRKKE